MPRALAVARAAACQAAGDLRPTLLGAGAFSILASSAPIILVGKYATRPIEGHLTFGPMLVAGSVGAIAGFIIMQIVGETYTDRLGGALLRVRILPHGAVTWALGKTMSSIVQTVVVQLALLAGAALFIDALDLNVSRAAACLPLIVLSAFAIAPLGFIVGSFTRGMYSMMVAVLLITALVITSGSFFPLGILPRWLQLIQLALPTYWSGHLTRWVIVGEPQWEPGGSFTPVLAVSILLAWAIVGFALVPFFIRRSFRKESIGSLAHMQSALRSQSGL